MENVRSIEASLPPEQTPTDQTINELKEELSQEFKFAANAVTKLYRIANEKNSILKHIGYIDCLNEIMKMIDDKKFDNLDDLKKWCNNERTSKLGMENNSSLNPTTDNNSSSSSSTQNNKVSNKNNQYASNSVEISTTRETNKSKLSSPKFRLSKPPFSVQQSNQTIQQLKARGKWANSMLKNNIDMNNINNSNNNNSNTNTVNFVRQIKRQKKKS